MMAVCRYPEFILNFIRKYNQNCNIMKKILLAVTALLFVSALSAQDLRIVNKKNAVAVPYNKVLVVRPHKNRKFLALLCVLAVAIFSVPPIMTANPTLPCPLVL